MNGPQGASQRPVVAGVPESGQDGTAGREAAPLAVVRDHVQHLHQLGGQLAAVRDGLTEVESWFWDHLADVRDAANRGDGFAADDELHVTDETLIQFPTDANVARRELARIQDVAHRYRDQAAKAERAVNLLAGSHRRAEEAEASTRASRYVADCWRSALSGQGNVAAAHALAMVGAALNGERDPAELGLPAEEYAAFRAAIAGPTPTP